MCKYKVYLSGYISERQSVIHEFKSKYNNRANAPGNLGYADISKLVMLVHSVEHFRTATGALFKPAYNCFALCYAN
jgi:hypothetical protein